MVCPRDRARDGRGIAQVSLHRVDLPDGSQRLQEEGAFGPARRDPDPVAASHQRLHHVAPEKTGPAENRDELLRRRANRGDHGSLLPAGWAGDGLETNVGPSLMKRRACVKGCTRGDNRPNPHFRRLTRRLRRLKRSSPNRHAQVAELVDALLSGSSDASRGGSSPLLGTNDHRKGLIRKETSRIMYLATLECYTECSTWPFQ